ncbi:hypothetical protein GGR56DRAFT_677622 [Xylariaceae sp. FL0804]|nr:hypothetical protein GGR56DRAFT_677622 [Xylariaceae sp. FL0804]
MASPPQYHHLVSDAVLLVGSCDDDAPPGMTKTDKAPLPLLPPIVDTTDRGVLPTLKNCPDAFLTPRSPPTPIPTTPTTPSSISGGSRRRDPWIRAKARVLAGVARASGSGGSGGGGGRPRRDSAPPSPGGFGFDAQRSPSRLQQHAKQRSLDVAPSHPEEQEPSLSPSLRSTIAGSSGSPTPPPSRPQSPLSPAMTKTTTAPSPRSPPPPTPQPQQQLRSSTRSSMQLLPQPFSPAAAFAGRASTDGDENKDTRGHRRRRSSLMVGFGGGGSGGSGGGVGGGGGGLGGGGIGWTETNNNNNINNNNSGVRSFSGRLRTGWMRKPPPIAPPAKPPQRDPLHQWMVDHSGGSLREDRADYGFTRWS